MEDLLIKGGRITTHNRQYTGDILISGGKIAGIGKDLIADSHKIRIIDASPYLVLPGGIDPHVHMEFHTGGTRSSDNFETGSLAALAGGTTTIIDFVTPEKGESLNSALEKRKREAEKSLCDYALHMSVTSIGPETKKEINNMVRNEGITSFKLYMAYKNSVGMDDADILTAMDMIKNAGGISMIHCENGDAIDFLKEKLKMAGRSGIRYYPGSRTPETEHNAVERAVFFTEITGCPLYIVHLSTERGVNKVLEAKKKGIPVFAETCPHYLLLEDSVYEAGKGGAKYIMSPPLRKSHDINRLWEGLSDGTIEAVSTDHCPYNLKDKNSIIKDDFSFIPKGVGGIDHRLSLLYTNGVADNKISTNRFVNLVSTRPAKIFGLYPSKGALLEGSDADIVLWDPGLYSTISAKDQFQNCDTSVYEDFKTSGGPAKVIAGGKIVFENGLFDFRRAKGNYLFRKR